MFFTSPCPFCFISIGTFADTDPWLCCNHFTIADIYLATFLHRMVLLGLAKRFWADGKRPYIAQYYSRVQTRASFKAASGNANKMFRSVILPKVSYYFRKAMPRVTRLTLVAAVVGFGVYVRYKGFPSWWPKTLRFWVWVASNGRGYIYQDSILIWDGALNISGNTRVRNEYLSRKICRW